MKKNDTIFCIVCKEELYNLAYDIGDERIEVHPVEGLHFRTYGHYGSGIFDPLGTGEYLDVAICDECIMKNKKHVKGTGKKLLDDGDND